MPNDKLERDCWIEGKLLCGCDEAGYGSSAGSLYSSCVVFPTDFNFSLLHGLNDSKKISEEKRFKLEKIIKDNSLWHHVGRATPQEIDGGNVFWMRFELMAIAIESGFYNKNNLIVYVDGDQAIRFSDGTQSMSKIRGDEFCLTISAASILSKAAKDREMIELDLIHPEYNWVRNKGYNTPEHIKAIKEFGLTPHHRRSYCKKYI